MSQKKLFQDQTLWAAEAHEDRLEIYLYLKLPLAWLKSIKIFSFLKELCRSTSEKTQHFNVILLSNCQAVYVLHSLMWRILASP